MTDDLRRSPEWASFRDVVDDLVRGPLDQTARHFDEAFAAADESLRVELARRDEDLLKRDEDVLEQGRQVLNRLAELETRLAAGLAAGREANRRMQYAVIAAVGVGVVAVVLALVVR
jgi:CHASE3 domain sensor protein